ncbi:MAG: NUDIX hydrolase [Anaerolineae bacterium]|nr:NUDIX hydrolase [Anaerolineae bacterium]
MPPKAWTTKSSRDIYANKWMRLREDIAVLPDGQETIYGVCTFGECVGILPFVDPDHVILVRQYRYVQKEDFRWEMPTGGIKPGESPEQAVQRELAEEAGYEAGRLERINTYFTSKSVCDETAHLFLGYDLVQRALPPDDTEFFEVQVFDFEEALRLVRRSEIRDGMTVIAVLEAALRRTGAR